ncbi:MAG: hypothetical protein Q7S29_03480 [Candidatus Peribacter sp.]|nr:hypothetical protein [Candidatus Peribacter sp.]
MIGAEKGIFLGAEPEDRDFLLLSTTPAVKIFCVGDASIYRTTGRGTVLCDNGKEYPLIEQEIADHQPGRKMFMTFVDSGVMHSPVRFSERMEVINPAAQQAPTVDPARICRGILEGTLLPTREQFNRALAVFHEGQPNGKLMGFCLEHELFEVLTKEYIEALATYLEERIGLLQSGTGKPVTILEVGAGDGRLTHFLKKELDRRGVQGYHIIATDAMGGQWQIRPRYPVNKEVVDMALWDFEPQIVLACWMPRNEDWTGHMRGTPSVEEYMLIGPKDSGTCGLDDETWGKNQEGAQTRYRQEGFERVELPELSALQMGQKDRNGMRFSSTVSFRRLPKEERAEGKNVA